ncbi:hypothetical protein Tco_0660185 [Tanacetum coccineum]
MGLIIAGNRIADSTCLLLYWPVLGTARTAYGTRDLGLEEARNQPGTGGLLPRDCPSNSTPTFRRLWRTKRFQTRRGRSWRKNGDPDTPSETPYAPIAFEDAPLVLWGERRPPFVLGSEGKRRATAPQVKDFSEGGAFTLFSFARENIYLVVHRVDKTLANSLRPIRSRETSLVTGTVGLFGRDHIHSLASTLKDLITKKEKVVTGKPSSARGELGACPAAEGWQVPMKGGSLRKRVGTCGGGSSTACSEKGVPSTCAKLAVACQCMGVWRVARIFIFLSRLVVVSAQRVVFHLVIKSSSPATVLSLGKAMISSFAAGAKRDNQRRDKG